jgi:Long-chain acyl-CoA synthetases (AMP-forming)
MVNDRPGCTKDRGVLVPVYPTINVNELQFILNDSQAKVIFVNDEELFLKVKSIKDLVPSLKNIFTLEHVTNATYWRDCLKPATTETIYHRTIIFKDHSFLILPLSFILPAQLVRQKG